MNANDMLIALIKSLLDENINEIRANVCFNNAVSAVREYVHKGDIDVAELYPYQIAQLAFYYYKSFDDMNVQSKSQGNRSITYAAKGIPDDIKKTLPRYVKPF